MALADYLSCWGCRKKLCYDGYDQIRDQLEEEVGDPEAKIWTVRAYCESCAPADEKPYIGIYRPKECNDGKATK